jgi:hypothetical protein
LATAVLLVFPAAALADVGPPPPRFRALPPPGVVNLAATAQGRLESAQGSLAEALAALNRANGSRGPLLDTAIADVKAAAALVSEARDYVKTHPESDALPLGPTPEAGAFRLTGVPSGSRVPGVNLLTAMEALNAALGQFLSYPASHAAVVGDLSGRRTKLEEAISRASDDVLAIISPGRPSAAAAATTPLAQSKATAAALLPIVQATLANTGFVGHNNAGGHAGLYSDLTRLESAAVIMENDDGNDPEASRRKNLELARALDAAINRAAAISVRPTETDQAKATSDQLHAQLLQSRNP